MPLHPESNELEPIEPLASLRAHPEWFFDSGKFESETVTGLLIREAALSPAVRSANFATDGAWTVIAADGDWLDGDLRAFSTPTPFPESGVNAIRVEVLLTAFCDTVATRAGDRRDDINSARSSEMPEIAVGALLERGKGRVIVFRAPEAQASARVTPISSAIFTRSFLEDSEGRLERAYA